MPDELFAPAAVDNANFGGGFDLFSDDEDIYRDTSSEKDHILVIFWEDRISVKNIPGYIGESEEYM